jgi:hypothetical protein
MIAMSYALNPDDVWIAYERVGSLDKLLNLIETNKLQEILATFPKE